MKSVLKGLSSQYTKSHMSPNRSPSPERIDHLTSIDPKHATIKFAEGG